MTTAPHAAARPAGSDPAGDVAVALRSLTGRYGGRRVVDDVTLALRPGAIAGLIGRNGSGKTTLLRMIAGQERPTAGRIAVMGAEPFENPSVMAGIVLLNSVLYVLFVAHPSHAGVRGSGPERHGREISVITTCFTKERKTRNRIWHSLSTSTTCRRRTARWSPWMI